MDRDSLKQDAYESAARDIDETIGSMVVAPTVRQILLVLWVKGAHWGLLRGVNEGQLTAEAVIREMQRRKQE